MDHKSLDRRNRLYALAQEDLAYPIWNRDHEGSRQAFYQFYDSQPESVQYLLHRYVDCGFIAMQRLIDLACENMAFPDEE